MNTAEDFNKETESAVYFFTPRFYALDNFSAYVVEIWGKKFPTSEHAYQWKKYSESNPELAEAVFSAGSAYAVKKLADANRDTADSKWLDVKAAIMEEICRAKLEQHEKVKKTLVETGSKEIIENSPDDEYWGIGSGSGQNMLGKIRMKLRDELKQI